MGEQVAAGIKNNTADGCGRLPIGCPDGDVAQLGEHLPCKQGVKGSIPSISIVGL